MKSRGLVIESETRSVLLRMRKRFPHIFLNSFSTLRSGAFLFCNTRFDRSPQKAKPRAIVLLKSVCHSFPLLSLTATL
jgi:hypothetical protein